jgi:hypothetical protein
MIKHINTIEKILNKHYEIIHDYNLKLSDLPILNIKRATYPELIASTSEITNLTSLVQDS